jgi:hypothetical protein
MGARSLRRLRGLHAATVGPGRRGAAGEQARQEETDQGRDQRRQRWAWAAARWAADAEWSDSTAGGDGVRGDDRPYSAGMRVARGRRGARRWLPVALAAVIALGGGSFGGWASDASGSSGPPATINVWPSPARIGHEAVVDIGERGAKAGDGVLECVTPPGPAGASGPATPVPHCAEVILGSGGQATTRFAAKRLGAWSVSVVANGRRTTRTVEVVPGRLRLLATGDSEIQELDDMLGSALGPKGVTVTGEAHISTGISKPFMFDWVKHAAAQAAGIRPDITVMFIGANDGFPLPAANGQPSYCCGEAWVDAFAKRTESMMASYVRGGAGRVYWFTLPAPRNAAAQPVFRAINRAYAIAAASFPYGVGLIDLVPVFTPGGEYRQDMTYDGRTVDVREPDGYHLSLAGDAIARNILLARLRADGLVR